MRDTSTSLMCSLLRPSEEGRGGIQTSLRRRKTEVIGSQQHRGNPQDFNPPASGNAVIKQLPHTGGSFSLSFAPLFLQIQPLLSLQLQVDGLYVVVPDESRQICSPTVIVLPIPTGSPSSQGKPGFKWAVV